MSLRNPPPLAVILPRDRWVEFVEVLDEASYILGPVSDELHAQAVNESDPEYAAELREEEAVLGHVYEMIAQLRQTIEAQTGGEDE